MAAAVAVCLGSSAPAMMQSSSELQLRRGWWRLVSTHDKDEELSSADRPLPPPRLAATSFPLSRGCPSVLVDTGVASSSEDDSATVRCSGGLAGLCVAEVGSCAFALGWGRAEEEEEFVWPPTSELLKWELFLSDTCGKGLWGPRGAGRRGVESPRASLLSSVLLRQRERESRLPSLGMNALVELSLPLTSVLVGTEEHVSFFLCRAPGGERGGVE